MTYTDDLPFDAFFDAVYVEQKTTEEESTSAGGVVLPGTNNNKQSMIATVVAIGIELRPDSKSDTKSYLAGIVKVGDVVHINPYAGQVIELEDGSERTIRKIAVKELLGLDKG